LYSGNPTIRKIVNRHVAPPERFILIPSQPVFSLFP
jgi:hypothetical protein